MVLGDKLRADNPTNKYNQGSASKSFQTLTQAKKSGSRAKEWSNKLYTLPRTSISKHQRNRAPLTRPPHTLVGVPRNVVSVPNDQAQWLRTEMLRFGVAPNEVGWSAWAAQCWRGGVEGMCLKRFLKRFVGVLGRFLVAISTGFLFQHFHSGLYGSFGERLVGFIALLVFRVGCLVSQWLSVGCDLRPFWCRCVWEHKSMSPFHEIQKNLKPPQASLNLLMDTAARSGSHLDEAWDILEASCTWVQWCLQRVSFCEGQLVKTSLFRPSRVTGGFAFAQGGPHMVGNG